VPRLFERGRAQIGELPPSGIGEPEVQRGERPPEPESTSSARACLLPARRRRDAKRYAPPHSDVAADSS